MFSLKYYIIEYLNFLTMHENIITSKILSCAFDIHTQLGPGLLENAYLECLYYRIKDSGLYVEKQKPMPLRLDDVSLECGYRIDLLVENKVVVEVKSCEALKPIHFVQTLTYMKLGAYRLGLLINFNELSLKDGIKRIINGKLSQDFVPF